jgi:hypothetical protein
MSARKRLTASAALGLLVIALAVPATVQADFGIKSLSAVSRNEDESIDLQAGSHPYEYDIRIEMNQNGEEPEGKLSELVVDLPPGLVGNPRAMPRCKGFEFEGQLAPCPGNSQIGTVEVSLGDLGLLSTLPIYNLTPPFAVPASVGFSIVGFNTFAEGSVRTGGDYGIRVSDITVPTELKIRWIRVTVWGVPADPSHDAERTCINEEGGLELDCSTDTPKLPFLTLPTSCTGPLQTTVTVRSLEGAEDSKPFQSVGEGGTPEGLGGCERPGFQPTISSQPETTVADSPTGLKFSLHLPQNEDPEGIATAHLKDAVVTLPPGLAVNPSTADGLEACSPAQINLNGPEPAQCPPNSEVGTVKAETPLLDHPVLGSVFIAKQGDNPFGSLIALYVALHDPFTGVVVKLAGKVEPDPVTGQLRATFKENPQLPVEDFDFEFFGGPQASLTTPPTCPIDPNTGSNLNTTVAQLTPWTSPQGVDVFPTSSFQILSAPGGGRCAPTEAQMPNAPGFEAASEVALAGSFTPFGLKLTRENGSQRFAALNTTLPPGLSAKLAGVSECSDAQIAQAQSRSNPGQGALEKQSPSCPSSSHVGVVNVGAGSGAPFFVQGDAYLAGPYKGAPLSLAIITPAVAGPFDLGTVVVRAALEVNEETAQASVKSDPVPTILQGIPLDVRTIVFKTDRPEFALNPTSCDEKQVTGQEVSTTGAVANLSSRFQVGGCKGLDYSPKFNLSLKGAVKRSGHPTLRAVLTQPAEQANSRRIVTILPATEFIDPLRTANPCTRPQFAEGKCPASSVLGKARVFTPLLDKPLEGPIYFRANGGARELPDVVLDLHGQVHFVQVGFVDAVHRKGSETSRVRTIFNNIPDAPLTKAIIELKGGKKGTLVNSANLCKVPPVASVKMSAQNNKGNDFEKKMGTSCKK